MTKYTLTHLILVILTYPVTLTLLVSLGCNFEAKDLHQSVSYQCHKHCTKSRTNPPDLSKVELNFRICSHPDLTDSVFEIVRRERSLAEISIVSHKHRRKRALLLTPSWKSEPQSISVNQESVVEIGCSLYSVSTAATCEWFYSETFPSQLGYTLSDPYNVVDDTGTLLIQSASFKDAGFYQCKVTDVTKDGHRVVYSNIVEVQIETYYLQKPYEMERKPISSFSAEDLLILSCPEVDSNPPATISWFKDNQLFNEEKSAFVYPFDGEQSFDYNSETYPVTKNSLVLMSISSKESGEYKCRATNPKTLEFVDLKSYKVINYASTDSSLNIEKPIVLKESPVTVEEGQTVDLYCLGIGHPTDMTYTWTFGSNNTPLDFRGDRISSSDFGRHVKIMNAVMSDQELYKCSCSNVQGNTDTYYNVKIGPPTQTQDITIDTFPEPLYLYDVYSDNPTEIFIPCTATGADQVRIWKDGLLLRYSDKYTFNENRGLTFTSYDSGDSGIYQCVASNTKEWKQKMTFVAITEKVTVKAAADVTRKDADATLTCVVTGYPYPEVSWTHDGTTISNTSPDISPYIIDSKPKHTLVIRRISFEDGGVYTCSAISQTVNHQLAYSHSATDEVTLTIVQEIRMRAADEYKVATVDEDLKLRCTADAKPAPEEVVWYVNSTKIDIKLDRYSVTTKEVSDFQVFSELLINDLVISDGGIYKCEAQNTVQSNTKIHSAETNVDVKYLTVTIEDNIRPIAPGDSVTITCLAEGTPKPQQIKWFKGSSDGEALTSSKPGYKFTDKDINYAYQSVLEIDQQISDQDYVCEASNYLNDVGQFEEAKAILRTFTEVKAESNTPVVVTDVGAAAALTCFCRGVPLPTEAVWKKDDTVVFTTSAISIISLTDYDPEFEQTSVLSFTDPVAEDVAVYTCTCTNTFQGNSFTDTTAIEFGVASSVSITWNSDNLKSAPYGNELSLTCTVTGLPLPVSTVWSRQRNIDDTLTAINVVGDSRFSVIHTKTSLSSLRSVLTFARTEYSDDGEYSCSVNSSVYEQVSTTSASNHILIYQNPSIEMGTNEFAAEEGSGVDLSCKASSKPAPTKLEWYFGDDLISDVPEPTSSGFGSYEMKSLYTVTGVSASDQGKYKCVGYHNYEEEEAQGEDYTYIRLYQQLYVDASTSPQIGSSISENTSLMLTCVAFGVPEVDAIQWTIDSVFTESSEITSNLGAVVTTTNYERSDFNIEVKSVLEIPNVKYINLGTYKCATSQTWKQRTESVVKKFAISVAFEAKVKSTTNSTAVFQEVGSQVRLTCAVYGNPTPEKVTWKWMDSDRTISSSSEFTIQNFVVNAYKKQSVLQFVFLPMYHGKVAGCTSKNSLSLVDAELPFTLNVIPDTITILENGRIEDKESFTLTCLTSFSDGIVTWYKDRSKLQETNRMTISKIDIFSTVNSVLTIKELDERDDAGDYVCEVVDGDAGGSASYQLLIGVAVVNVAGLSKGIIIALIVLGVVILIVLILMILLFVHGRRRRSRQYDEPDGYKNKVFDDKMLPPLPPMIQSPTNENLPKVIEPINLSTNEPEHFVKEATIMQQATLNQQNSRNPNLGRSLTLDRPVQRTSSNEYGPPNYTLDHRNKRDWY